MAERRGGWGDAPPDPVDPADPGGRDTPEPPDLSAIATPARRVAGRGVGLVVLFALYAVVGVTVHRLLYPELPLPPDAPIGPEATGYLRLTNLLVVALTMAYEILPVRGWGRTPGKLAVGTRVVAADGGRPPWRAAVGRGVVLMGPTFLPFIGLYAPLIVASPLFFDSRRRGAHDRVAGTLVVTVPRPGPGG